MFRVFVALMVLSSTALAAEDEALCKPSPVAAAQVTATATYQGQQFAFTVTGVGTPQPGFDEPGREHQASAEAKPCPLTS